MIISQSGIVDIIPEYNRQLRPIFCVSEGDKNTRMINITVQQAGENFSIPSGASVYVTGKKQDNTIFTYQCTKSGYIVSFQIAEQMSAANGIVLCELQIIENGNPLGTANFVYWVEPSPIQNGTTSESDLNLFEEAISKFENFDHFYADVESMVTEAVANMQIREGQTVIDASLSVSGAAADAKATGDIVRAFMDALVTETTEEATIATCDDAAGGLPLKTLTANIVPAQAGSGDPSPDNVRPISGYTGVEVQRNGKNLFRPAASGGSSANVSYVRNDDYSLTFTGQANGTTRTPSLGTRILKAGTYILSGVSGGSADTYSLRIANTVGVTRGCTVYDGEGTFVVETDGAITVQGRFSNVQTAAYNVTMYPMIRLASETDDTYEPYNGATYPVTFPTEAGTVYGGTLVVNSDGSGALTVDRAITTYANRTWNFNVPSYVITILSNAKDMGTTPGTSEYDAVCSMLQNVGVSTVTNMPDVSMAQYGNTFRIKDSSCTTDNEYLAKYGAAQICYTLATPTTYALSAVQVATMLNGVNNIWTDAAGTLTTEYYASTGLYVEKKVNAQRNMIAGVEEAMIATKNYSVNDLLIVGNTLYKVTAAISSGAALVVGTNVTETTVAEQLLALA